MSAKRHKNVSFWDPFLPLPVAKIPSEDLRQTTKQSVLRFQGFQAAPLYAPPSPGRTGVPAMELTGSPSTSCMPEYGYMACETRREEARRRKVKEYPYGVDVEQAFVLRSRYSYTIVPPMIH